MNDKYRYFKCACGCKKIIALGKDNNVLYKNKLYFVNCFLEKCEEGTIDIPDPFLEAGKDND